MAGDHEDGTKDMVNTRILQQGLRPRSGEVEPAVPAEVAPRALRHDPILQGRVSNPRASGQRRGAAVGQTMPRNPAVQAELADLRAGLPQIADSLEIAAQQCGRVPAFDRTTATGMALDQLRSQLLRVTGEKGWRRLGIAAPRREAGSSFITLGLTASIARLDYLRLVMIDMDLSRPSLHTHLGLAAPGPLEELLAAGLPAIELVHRIGAGLAVVLNDTPVTAASELLYSPDTIARLRELDEALKPDMTLLDLPPLLSDPAAQAGLAQVDAVLLVADGTETTARDVNECERLLRDQVPLLGVVLNKSEDGAAQGRRN